MHYRRWMKHGTTDDPAEITRCIVGHEYTLANTYFDALGKRHCATSRLAANHERRARILATTVERVDFELVLAEYGMLCHLCTRPIASRDDLHFDHVIPLVRGGTHTHGNIRPAQPHGWQRAYGCCSGVLVVLCALALGWPSAKREETEAAAAAAAEVERREADAAARRDARAARAADAKAKADAAPTPAKLRACPGSCKEGRRPAKSVT